jgi:putative addiction module component (TIGR02574 family)
MSKTLDEVWIDLEQLDDDDRFVLAERLWASVPPDKGYERAWSEEIQRRLDDYDSGRTKGIPYEEVMRDLRERLK